METHFSWKNNIKVSVLSKFSSVAQSCSTLCNPMDCSTPSFPVLHHLPELVQTHVHWVGDTIQSSRLLSSPSPPASSLSQHQGLFQWISSSHQRPKYWGFSFSISLSHEYSGLISFRIHWLDLLAVQGTLKSLLQHHSSKASVLQRSVFFMPTLTFWKKDQFFQKYNVNIMQMQFQDKLRGGWFFVLELCMLIRFSCVQPFETLWTVAHQTPLSMGILQARILELVVMPSSRGSPQPRDCIPVS